MSNPEDSTDHNRHEWFDADGFRLATEKYGTVELYVASEETFTEEDHRGNPQTWVRDISIEGDCGDDGYRSFWAYLTQNVGEDSPILSIQEMVAPDEWDDIEYDDAEAIYDD